MKRVVALGFFDGVHLGHGALLRRTVERAAQMGARAAACTFDIPPAALISRAPVPLLTTPEERAGLMGELYGVEEVVVIPFDQAMRTMPWRAFVTDLLVARLGACHLVAGEDYRFGYLGQGDGEKLRTLCQELGLGCDIIPKVRLEGQVISSTYIRGLIQAGEMERAVRFLGHPHRLTGQVEHGKRLGSRLGFPTVNLTLPPAALTPAYGVYAARGTVLPPAGEPAPAEAAERLAVVNIGVRPTVDDGDRVTAEAYLLDFDGDLYGRAVRLELYRRLRPERKFDSLEDLRAAILENVRQTRAFFAPEG